MKYFATRSKNSKNNLQENQISYDKVFEKLSLESNLEFKTFSKKAEDSRKIVIQSKGLVDYPKDKIHYVYFDFDWKMNLVNLAEKAIRNDVVAIGITLPVKDWYLGKTTNSIVDKACTDIEELLDKGVPSKNIIIDGLCITSAFGTMVAKKLFDKGIVVNLFNDRSFSTLKNHVSRVKKEKVEYHKNTNHSTFLKNPLKPVLSSASTLLLDKAIVPIYANQLRNVGKDFVELYKANPDRINYTVYRPVMDEKGNREPDGTIAHQNSIHKNPELKKIRVLSKKPAKEAILLINEAIRDAKFSENDLESQEKVLAKQDSDKLLKKLRLKLFDYNDVRYQETNIKEQNIELFNDAIKSVQKGDYKLAINQLKLICFFINANHKYEKLYSDEEIKKLKLRKKFEVLYPKIYEDTKMTNLEKEYQLFLEKGLHNNLHVSRGHVIGRYQLYSRLYNMTLNPNHNLEQDKVKPWIKEINGGDLVLDGSSAIDLFIKDIKEINRKEFDRREINRKEKIHDLNR